MHHVIYHLAYRCKRMLRRERRPIEGECPPAAQFNRKKPEIGIPKKQILLNRFQIGGPLRAVLGEEARSAIKLVVAKIGIDSVERNTIFDKPINLAQNFEDRIRNQDT